MKQSKVIPLFLLSYLLVLPTVNATAQKEKPYLIGRDDVLDVTVWQVPDLTKSLRVQSDGTVDFPLLGNLSASGLTPAELAKLIQDKLSQGYVKEPKVSISVKEYNSKKILVFGEAGQPGLYKLKGETPLLEILFMVGGVKPDAKRMTIIRPSPQNSTETTPPGSMPSPEPGAATGSSQTIEVDLISLLSKGELSQNIMIQPGDTLYFASGTGLRFHVLGQVGNPGPYEWVQDITVLEAIKLAGGVKDRGAPNRIKVRKMHDGQKMEIKVNMVEIMKGKKKDDIIVKPGDVIIVPESWI